MADLDILLVQVARLAVDELAQDAHKAIDLARGTRPIFGREGVECQIAHPLLAALAHDPADVLGAGAMPGQTRQPAPLGPAPITIHDDRDMAWDARAIA